MNSYPRYDGKQRQMAKRKRQIKFDEILSTSSIVIERISNDDDDDSKEQSITRTESKLRNTSSKRHWHRNKRHASPMRSIYHENENKFPILPIGIRHDQSSKQNVSNKDSVKCKHKKQSKP